MARKRPMKAGKGFMKALEKSREKLPADAPEVPPKRSIKLRKEWEAEELRRGLEQLCSDGERSADIDRDEPCVRVADIEHLLDKVDARDSLAYIERRDRAPNRQYG
jgi:hypothetical protein